MTSKNLVRSLCLVATLLLVSGASAGPSAKGFVQAKHGQLTTLVQGKGGGNDSKLQALFDEIIDYEALAQRSLDEHWEKRTAEERAEFTRILQQLVRRAYRKNLDKTVGYEVSYDGESSVGQGRLVKTVARSKSDRREEPVAIDYLVEPAGGSWRIVDIVTEGSSLVNNYRRQFARIIDKKGFTELLTRMKRKLNKDG